MNTSFYRKSMQYYTVLLMVFLASSLSFGQLTGTKTIPGDYATIALAIADLNTNGVGTGGVTFNVSAGHTETFAASNTGLITATGTAADQIVFQKSGTGANPVITSGTGVSTSVDGIIVIAGGDYITFNGIDVVDNPANADNTQRMEWGYALVKGSASAPFNGSQYVVIKNCTITLNKANTAAVGIYSGNHTAAVTTSLTITDPLDAVNNCKFFGNNISNVYIGIRIAGYLASSPYALYDQNNEIGVEAGNSITNYGGAATTSYGIYAIYQNNLKIANNTINGGTGQTTTFYGIFTSTGVNSNVDVFGNTITLTPEVTTSTVYGINNAMGSTGTDNTVNIYNNILENCTFSTATSAAFYGIYSTATPLNINMYGNTVRNNTKPGTGAAYLLYNSNTAANGFEKMYDNAVYGNSNTGAGTMYGLYSNPVSTSTKNVYNNSIYGNSSNSTIYGLYSSAGLLANVYKNKIYDITTNGASSAAYGIYQTTGAAYYYNNFVSDIKAPSSTSSTAVTGIYISSGNTGLYYNTVYLNAASSSATTFGSSGIYASSTPNVDMINNIVVNNSTPGPTGGFTVAYRRSTTTLTTYANTSNNNDLFAGVPGPANLIFYDGTNADQTLAEFKTRVNPRDANSISENAPFVNGTTAPYNLHISTTTPTQLESGGTPVTAPIAITLDIDDSTRNASTPDIGADEFPGLSADLTAPLISYSPLQNTTSLLGRTLTAQIEDQSGVPTAGIGLPVLYWKINSGTWNSSQGVFVSGNQYTFNFGTGVALNDSVYYYIAAQDMAGTPNVGTFPAAGSGNFTYNPPAAGTPPTNPSRYLIIDFPITAGTYTVGLTAFKQATGKNVYFEKRTRTVIKDRLAADSEVDINGKSENPDLEDLPRYVEVTQEYLEMMENGEPFDMGFFASEDSRGVYPTISAAVHDMYLRGISGPVTFSLVDTDYPNETYPIDIQPVAGASSVNTVTFKPAPGVQTKIPGSISQTTGTFRLGGSSYITIDGSNTVNGTTKDLTITGLASGTYPAVHFYSAASNNVVKNVILESQNNSTGSGTLLFGSGPAACNDNLIDNCLVKEIDTAAVKHYVAVYFFSSHTGSGAVINNCELKNFTDYGIRLQGAPAPNIRVSNNYVYQTVSSTKSIVYGLYISRNPGLVIENNVISDLQTSNTSKTIIAVYVLGSSGNPVDIIVRNNVVSLSSLTNMTLGTIRGIDYFGSPENSMEVYYNTVYIGGADVTAGTTACLGKRDDANTYKAYNNALYNARSNGSGTGKHYAVYFSDLNTTTLAMNNNDYHVSGTGGVFGYYGTADVANLEAWRTASSQDANSISADPLFVSNLDDYRPMMGSPLINAGTPITGITTDILGITRGATPTIGAYEQGVVMGINAPANLIAVADTHKITLSWTDLSSNETGFKVERKLGDSTSVNPWSLIDSVAANATAYVDTGLQAQTTYTYRVFAFSPYTVSPYSNLATAVTLIPVELISLSANVSERTIEVSWSTATESNSHLFQVERSSADDQNWTVVGKLNAAGSSSERHDYLFTDKNLNTGKYNYRLKMIDLDGSYKYSSVIEAEIGVPVEFSLSQNYPNPFNPTTRINYQLPVDAKVTIELYDVTGQKVAEMLNQDLKAGYHTLEVSGLRLVSGMYIYRMTAVSNVDGSSFMDIKKMMMLK